ncbi:Oidioi.mRNA.OKI2018_I69.chr2.g4579.t2.cds [Oikopleura dioica]|uniref:Oidioi.mRNA.OKI2018_I69.chr2.g4579.t2.cds n=1 Tax=Oikopleura dioica TaxID=34765 RepID=A0ABN7SY70_OIKDI|nr:Oidioi.mRNA.OKI2018_I69.chr2.g4579.t2.cds [Oikopleura dioica]
MKLLTAALAQAAQGTLLVSDFNTGTQLSSAFADVTLSTPLELFGTREFTNVYVNEAGSVSFDKEFLNINAGSQTLQPSDPHKIVIGPYLGDFASVTTYYDQTLSTASKSAVDAFVQTHSSYPTYASSYNLVVTWDSATGGTGTPGSSQLVLTSNGGLHFALLSYDSTTPDFSTAQGNNGADAYAGILTHKGRDALCLSTISDATDGGNEQYLFSLVDFLSCTHSASFSECGEYKNDYNEQYQTELVYKTVASSSSLGFFWEAIASCYDGFAIDASGNKKFPAQCIYEADQYYTSWSTPINPRTSETYRCKQVTNTFVQINAVSISLDALGNTPFSLLAGIDVTKLTTLGQLLWLVLLKFAVAMQINDNLSLPNSMHIDGVRRIVRREADDISRMRRAVTTPTGPDFIDLLDELGVWMDTSSFNNFADITTALNDIAVATDALNSDIDSIDFTVGVDASGVTAAEIKQMVVDAITVTADVTVNTGNVDNLISDIDTQISGELNEVLASSSCLGGNKNIPSQPNPLWVKPDQCCGSKPIASAQHGCCQLSNGNLRYFLLDSQSCCNGQIVAAGDPSCTTTVEEVDIM